MKILNVIAFNAYWGSHLPANVLDLEEGPTVGGGEEAGLRCGLGLHQLGHEVLTYWYGRGGNWRGMEMRSIDDELYGTLVSGEWDAVASWSGLRALEWVNKRKDGQYPKRLFFQQLNDLFSPGGWDRVDAIVSPSRSHAEQLAGWGWKKRPIAVVHNGLDIDQYRRIPAGTERGMPARGEDAPAWDSRPMDVGYWSSPDRGLHHLLAAWPHVTKAIPEARLRVFYEIDRYLEGATMSPGLYCERAQQLKLLLTKAKLDKSVIFHGAIPRKKLAPIQKQCRVLFYDYDPVFYCEGFAGSINQGRAAGCLVATNAKDALPSLYGDTLYWLDQQGGPSKLDDGYYPWLAQQVILGLRGDLPDQDAIRKRGALRAAEYTWDRAGKEIEAACRGEGWFTL